MKNILDICKQMNLQLGYQRESEDGTGSRRQIASA